MPPSNNPLSSSSWITRQSQVPFDDFTTQAFGDLYTYYDSLDKAKHGILEGIQQLIERCQSPIDKQARQQNPMWLYAPFCEILFNQNVSPSHYSNAGFTELPDWEGGGPLKECWPSASLLHFQDPMKITDLAQLPEIPLDKLLLPVFLHSGPLSPAPTPIPTPTPAPPTTTTTTTTVTMKDPVKAQAAFAHYILTHHTPRRKFLITMVIRDFELQLWYHTTGGNTKNGNGGQQQQTQGQRGGGEGLSIPSSVISLEDPTSVQSLYRLLWRLACLPHEHQFGL